MLQYVLFVLSNWADPPYCTAPRHTQSGLPIEYEMSAETGPNVGKLYEISFEVQITGGSAAGLGAVLASFSNGTQQVLQLDGDGRLSIIGEYGYADCFLILEDDKLARLRPRLYFIDDCENQQQQLLYHDPIEHKLAFVVHGSDSQPLSGAIVQMFDQKNSLLAVEQTDEEGKFQYVSDYPLDIAFVNVTDPTAAHKTWNGSMANPELLTEFLRSEPIVLQAQDVGAVRVVLADPTGQCRFPVDVALTFGESGKKTVAGVKSCQFDFSDPGLVDGVEVTVKVSSKTGEFLADPVTFGMTEKPHVQQIELQLAQSKPAGVIHGWPIGNSQYFLVFNEELQDQPVSLAAFQLSSNKAPVSVLVDKAAVKLTFASGDVTSDLLLSYNPEKTDVRLKTSDAQVVEAFQVPIFFSNVNVAEETQLIQDLNALRDTAKLLHFELPEWLHLFTAMMLSSVEADMTSQYGADIDVVNKFALPVESITTRYYPSGQIDTEELAQIAADPSQSALAILNNGTVVGVLFVSLRAIVKIQVVDAGQLPVAHASVQLGRQTVQADWSGLAILSAVMGNYEALFEGATTYQYVLVNTAASQDDAQIIQLLSVSQQYEYSLLFQYEEEIPGVALTISVTGASNVQLLKDATQDLETGILTLRSTRAQSTLLVLVSDASKNFVTRTATVVLGGTSAVIGLERQIVTQFVVNVDSDACGVTDITAEVLQQQKVLATQKATDCSFQFIFHSGDTAFASDPIYAVRVSAAGYTTATSDWNTIQDLNETQMTIKLEKAQEGQSGIVPWAIVQARPGVVYIAMTGATGSVASLNRFAFVLSGSGATPYRVELREGGYGLELFFNPSGLLDETQQLVYYLSEIPKQQLRDTLGIQIRPFSAGLQYVVLQSAVESLNEQTNTALNQARSTQQPLKPFEMMAGRTPYALILAEELSRTRSIPNSSFKTIEAFYTAFGLTESGAVSYSVYTQDSIIQSAVSAAGNELQNAKNTRYALGAFQNSFVFLFFAMQGNAKLILTELDGTPVETTITIDEIQFTTDEQGQADVKELPYGSYSVVTVDNRRAVRMLVVNETSELYQQEIQLSNASSIQIQLVFTQLNQKPAQNIRVVVTSKDEKVCEGMTDVNGCLICWLLSTTTAATINAIDPAGKLQPVVGRTVTIIADAKLTFEMQPIGKYEITVSVVFPAGKSDIITQVIISTLQNQICFNAIDKKTAFTFSETQNTGYISPNRNFKIAVNAYGYAPAAKTITFPQNQNSYQVQISMVEGSSPAQNQTQNVTQAYLNSVSPRAGLLFVYFAKQLGRQYNTSEFVLQRSGVNETPTGIQQYDNQIALTFPEHCAVSAKDKICVAEYKQCYVVCQKPTEFALIAPSMQLYYELQKSKPELQLDDEISVLAQALSASELARNKTSAIPAKAAGTEQLDAALEPFGVFKQNYEKFVGFNQSLTEFLATCKDQILAKDYAGLAVGQSNQSWAVIAFRRAHEQSIQLQTQDGVPVPGVALAFHNAESQVNHTSVSDINGIIRPRLENGLWEVSRGEHKVANVQLSGENEVLTVNAVKLQIQLKDNVTWGVGVGIRQNETQLAQQFTDSHGYTVFTLFDADAKKPFQVTISDPKHVFKTTSVDVSISGVLAVESKALTLAKQAFNMLALNIKSGGWQCPSVVNVVVKNASGATIHSGSTQSCRQTFSNPEEDVEKLVLNRNYTYELTAKNYKTLNASFVFEKTYTYIETTMEPAGLGADSIWLILGCSLGGAAVVGFTIFGIVQCVKKKKLTEQRRRDESVSYIVTGKKRDVSRPRAVYV